MEYVLNASGELFMPENNKPFALRAWQALLETTSSLTGTSTTP